MKNRKKQGRIKKVCDKALSKKLTCFRKGTEVAKISKAAGRFWNQFVSDKDNNGSSSSNVCSKSKFERKLHAL